MALTGEECGEFNADELARLAGISLLSSDSSCLSPGGSSASHAFLGGGCDMTESLDGGILHVNVAKTPHSKFREARLGAVPLA